MEVASVNASLSELDMKCVHKCGFLNMRRGFLYMRIFKYAEVINHRPFIYIYAESKAYFLGRSPHIKKNTVEVVEANVQFS